VNRRTFEVLGLAVFLAASIICSAVLVAMLQGCSGGKRIDPPLYFESSLPAARLAAHLHAQDAGGVIFQLLPTGSMEPLMKGGDFIVVRGGGFDALQEGQVIAYRAAWIPGDGLPVAHRLVGRDSHGWILSGDNNPRSEPQWRVTERNYIGLVIAIYRVAP
jgi:signal peptidase I